MNRFWKASCIGFCSLIAVGCGKTNEPMPEKQPAGATAEDDHHHDAGPHGGTVADWGGGEYHVELTVDHGKKEAVVYVLDGDAKNPVPVKAKKVVLSIDEPAFQVELVAQPLEGEADGASSRFVGQHNSLGKDQKLAGTISGEVDGTPYAGDFKEAAEGHDHPR